MTTSPSWRAVATVSRGNGPSPGGVVGQSRIAGFPPAPQQRGQLRVVLAEHGRRRRWGQRLAVEKYAAAADPKNAIGGTLLGLPPNAGWERYFGEEAATGDLVDGDRLRDGKDACCRNPGSGQDALPVLSRSSLQRLVQEPIEFRAVQLAGLPVGEARVRDQVRKLDEPAESFVLF